MLLNEYFLIIDNRPAIRQDAFLFYGIKPELFSKLIKTEEASWDSQQHKVGNRFYKFYFLDSIPQSVKDKYKFPDPQVFFTDEVKNEIDPKLIKSRKLAELTLRIDVAFSNYLKGDQKKIGVNFERFIKKGFDIQEASQLSKAVGLVEICLDCRGDYATGDIYKVLFELAEHPADKKQRKRYESVGIIKSSRSFYRHFEKLEIVSTEKIDSILINGLTGKPSNRRLKCEKTKKLIFEYLKQINGPADTVVTMHINSIILALPKIFNNGKLIKRHAVSTIKAEKINEIRAAREGSAFIENELTNKLHLHATRFALDRVEFDFTKIHAKMVDDKGKKVRRRMICAGKDRHSKAIIGISTGKSECFALLRKAIYDMFRKTDGYAPAQFIIDRSPAIKHKRFKMIRKFLTGLLGEDGVKIVRKARGKPGIESHWNLMFEVYLPEHVGTTGGNIATSKRHRPRREILVLFEKEEYLNDIDHWDKIVRDIDIKYNETISKDGNLSPKNKFEISDKPRAVYLSEQFRAFVSWHCTTSTFQNFEFKVEFEGKDYFFGWLSQEVNADPRKKEFVLKNTGEKYDIYFDEYNMGHVHVFEKDTPNYVFELKCTQWFWGNSADQAEDPKRLKSLLNEAAAKKIFMEWLNRTLQSNSKDVMAFLGGVSLNDFLKGLAAKGKNENDILWEIVSGIVSGRTVKEINPFGGQFPERKPMKRTSLKSAIQPKKIGNKE